jgi:hypothetical protein
MSVSVSYRVYFNFKKKLRKNSEKICENFVYDSNVGIKILKKYNVWYIILLFLLMI